MDRLLDLPLADLSDPDIQILLHELSDAAEIDYRRFPTLHFVPFLQLCLHPQGGNTKRVPLHLSRTRPGLLETRIDKITSQRVHRLCTELAASVNEQLEMHINRKLMTFLNLVIRTLEKKRPKPKTRR